MLLALDEIGNRGESNSPRLYHFYVPQFMNDLFVGLILAPLLSLSTYLITSPRHGWDAKKLGRESKDERIRSKKRFACLALRRTGKILDY